MSLYGNKDKNQDSAIAIVKETADSTATTATATAATVATLQTGVGFTLPTSDPAVAGELWSDAGVVTVSAG